MILTVTLNPAIDVTYHVDALVPGATHRVSRVDERLGGKGVNVASVLAQLGEPVVSTGLLRDGPAGFTPIAAAPRRTVVVTDGRDATGFWEPGPVVTPEEWALFTTHFAALVSTARVVVFSGSLPPSLPDHAYASLIGLARSAGCLSILDTSGPALVAGMLARPDVIKPNAAELAHLRAAPPLDRRPSTDSLAPADYSPPIGTVPPGSPASPASPAPPGSSAPPSGSPIAGGSPSPRGGDGVPGGSNNFVADATFLLRPHAEAGPWRGEAGTIVVESHGAEGLRALGWRARPPQHIEGNPTGAGDACVAALARGLLHGTPWPSLLRDAVALSAAAVASPIAGHVDLDLYQALIPEVIVEES